MNQDQLNRSEMFNTVSSYMGANASVWNGVPAIVATVADLNAKIGVINESGRKQQSPTTGAADQKESVRLDFEEKILEIANQLSALAAVRKDSNLGAQTEFTLSSLDKLSDDELEETGTSVAALAT